ncbi:MAG: aldo/keto reductase [Chloroflexota bacterium]|nr:aldo/keto reductase [Chloroflexota bacterium]
MAGGPGTWPPNRDASAFFENQTPGSSRKKAKSKFMEYISLGRTGVKVSKLCLGCMMFGGRTSPDDSYDITDKAIDAGINFLDTANVYSRGHSEKVTGEALSHPRSPYRAGAAAGGQDLRLRHYSLESLGWGFIDRKIRSRSNSAP